jgi:hypothetical protein
MGYFAPKLPVDPGRLFETREAAHAALQAAGYVDIDGLGDEWGNSENWDYPFADVVEVRS